MRRPLSIRARFLIVSLASVPLALVLAALFMISLFTSNLERRLDAELGGLVGTLAGAVGFGPDGALSPPAGLFDRRFVTPYGGLYWQIEDAAAGTQVRSESLWDFTLSVPPERDRDGSAHTYEIGGPDAARLTAQVRQVSVPSPTGPRALRIIVAADRAPLVEASRGFAWDIVPYIVGLAAFLIAASLLQLTYGLKPLSTLASALDRIRERRGEKLDRGLPQEFEPVEIAVNRLLDSQRQAIARARARAGDLAHGLKTPLTVLANDALVLRERGQGEIADEIEHLVKVMRTHTDRELVRARIVSSAELRQSDGDLAAIVGQVVRTLKRTAAGEAAEWIVDLPDRVVLPVDPHDLRELTGNIVENAVKWTRTRVAIRWVFASGTVMLVVEDDGPGVDPAKISTMTDRGTRHDERTPGTGLGLSIVREICDVYSLPLAIENRESGGLRVAVEFPSATA
ncbi:MAG: HAMP domain-containing histidine kinase [Mesorhizobium sp.]|nr:HAMP domain-containing sensor histidine kinase [Mesorhizobium sp.]MBL8579776.1 HAMP domain-containing histidine kinase [Mesorhizobium sp.]